MSRKEWLEVGRQSLFFTLALAAVPLLLTRLVDWLQGLPFSGEKFVIMTGLWLLVFSLFMGLSPFALDAKQKGMEYLLTLPLSRSRLLGAKFLPRLAAVLLFYLGFFLLYEGIGQRAFAGGFVFFSLSYFSLFLISFSLALVHENFVVQSVWAGAAWSGHLALCLLLVRQGFTWKFRMPASRLSAGVWLDLGYDCPTLLVAIAVFLLMTLPFLLSFFLAFRKFDLKPARAFNRRQLRIFLPLLLAPFALSLGITWLVQSGIGFAFTDYHILEAGQVLKTEASGRLTLSGKEGRRSAIFRGAAFWDQPVLQRGGRLFLSGYDPRTAERFLGVLDPGDFSWQELHRCPNRCLVMPFRPFRFDGERFLYLRRDREEAELPGMDGARRARSDALRLVFLDPDRGAPRAVAFQSPLVRRYSQPEFIGSGLSQGVRFWLFARNWHRVLRFWQDGRVEDLGVSKKRPAYAGGVLLSVGDGFLRLRRLQGAGGEATLDLPGDFRLPWGLPGPADSAGCGEFYAVRDRRIVRIDLTTMAASEVAPARGSLSAVSPGEFYYVEFQNWPGRPTDTWRRLHRLRDGKLESLKRFDFGADGYGHLQVTRHGVIFHQRQGAKVRLYAFPDLRELPLPE